MGGLLLSFAVGLLWAGVLTARPSPNWNLWRLAVVAGEFGHWLAGVALVVATLAWGIADVIGMATTAVAIAAAVLLLKPTLQARKVAKEVERDLDAMGTPVSASEAFSVRGFFRRGPQRVAVETRTFSDELGMDFYRPRGVTGEAPCVLVVHGGGWDGGSRAQLSEFNHWLAGRGYAVAAMSYRLAPAHRWPAQAEDVRAALAYLKQHVAEFGIDPRKLVLLGRSAGGQIALNVAYAARDPAICGAIGLYAPADLVLGWESGREDDQLGSRNLLRQYLGGSLDAMPEVYREASATTHVTQDSPPTLLVHGKLDTLVWCRHSEHLVERLRTANVPHAAVWLPWATHAVEFNLNGPGGQLTTYAVERFLARVTR